MIEIQDLHKSFGPKTVLGGVNLKITEGSAICIIGKSGCGKSVLLKHIVGLLQPDKGRVFVDGMDVGALSNKELFDLRRRIGFVFQGSALFDSMTVYENVVISLYEHGLRLEEPLEKEAKRVLSAVGLLPDPETATKEEFEREWKILKDKKPADLSGGMRKRVGVARALVGEPEYIFYDEPTTGLDPVTSEQIDDLIANLKNKFNVTSVVITHDIFSVMKVANQVVMLDSGLIRFEGTPEELNSSNDAVVMEFLDRYKKPENFS
jgi:phospholipid/cholesterol/gamma-HCH transport system ATP-binding protein